MKVTIVFDIGKTNKKCILFDKQLNAVYQVDRSFKSLKDEDGFPCDDLDGIVEWMYDLLKKWSKDKSYKIKAINISTYGASLVHLDKTGKVLTPLYNYLKPYPKSVLKFFYKKHGQVSAITQSTASPPSGMLNAGLQLFWLKKTKPKIFKKIKWSLHFPQYLSFALTGKVSSDYTSIGCHTSLWDYKKGTYHRWVFQEKLNRILAPIRPSSTFYKTQLPFYKKKIKVGIGVHDSSAAMQAFLKKTKKPFILLSTGTWNVALNPFSRGPLKKKDLAMNCLNYMRIDGYAVKAARLFLGNEHRLQVKQIARHFNIKKNFFKKIRFNKKLVHQLKKDKRKKFHIESIQPLKQKIKKSNFSDFSNATIAYHCLMLELVQLQVKYIRHINNKGLIKRLYIEGGFVKNELFIKLIKSELSDYKIKVSKLSPGPALGAALLVQGQYP